MLPPLDICVPYEHVISVAAVSVADRLLRGMNGQPISLSMRPVHIALTRGSLMNLRGLGREIWKELDADRYIRELREEWSE